MSGRRTYVIIATCFTAAIGISLAFLLFGRSSAVEKSAAAALILLCVLAVAAALSLKFLGRARTRELAINLSVTCVAVAIFLGAAEAATRFYYRDITTIANNSGYFVARWRKKVKPRRNRWGFRERKFAERPAPETYRIAVIGDSLTYGQGIPEADRMTNLLEARLNADGHSKFEVLNFGRPGAETVDELRILQNTVLHLHPDFILLQWYTNDVEGHDKSGRPHYANLMPIRVLHSALWNHSALYQVLDMMWIKLQIEWNLVGYSYDDYIVRRFQDPDSPSSKEAHAELTRFVKIVQAHHIPMGIVLYPHPVFWRGGPANYPMAFLHERVLKTCTKFDLPCLDLRKKIAAVPNGRMLEVDEFDPHPSAFANRLMTRAVLKKFLPIWASRPKAVGRRADEDRSTTRGTLLRVEGKSG